MSRIAFLDQNAWIALAQGSWDKIEYQREHAALVNVVKAVRSEALVIPLTFANIYETAKINDPVRRANMARTQALISGGIVFRSRRRILQETLATYVADRFSILRPKPAENWFLSNFWFESAADYSPSTYGFELSSQVLDFIRQNPGYALFDYLLFSDEGNRLEAVRRYSAGSADLIARIEARRALVAGQPLALRKRAYGEYLILDELDFILATGKRVGLNWETLSDIGSSLVRSMVVDVPVLNIERELVLRLEDQSRAINENDLRDMMSFITVVPYADIVVAEKPFVNLSRQAGFENAYGTTLLTSIFDFKCD